MDKTDRTLLVVAVVGLLAATLWIFYGGYHPDLAGWLIGSLIYFTICPVLLALECVRVIRLRRSRIDNHALGHYVCLFALGCGIVVTVCRPPCIAFTQGFLERVSSEISPESLRSWALVVIHSNEGKGYLSVNDELPLFLRHNTYRAVRDATLLGDEHRRYVNIEFGGGFIHWGLMVGDETFIFPSDGPKYIRVWRPGIFAYQAKM